ncbi:LacI family transcriptional regulator [Ectopseudomonas mendocina]|uniref:substrate-binding domain-containing protein n=1 Tax=Pseudomonas sp. o96-267 TaxID=2479853 RepID=UPI000F7A58C7|nr:MULTISPECIES: substrate-binding domain-containing protein [Pseudomonas]RRV21534.1 LacI family transcriptional regulator [Pseudomonas sp. o96-267]TRO24175.1 LacI family transcriptional regulator [Pseudomonas mendocina]TRO27084.1 LacI family transcriptional regulator [Pseudomonas mendocina]
MPRIIPSICLLLTALSLTSAPAWARDCIGMVPAGTSAFWSELEAGARRTAGELQLELYTRAPAQEGSVEVQLQLIDRVLAQGCKALIIAPAGDAVDTRVTALRAEGIPTVYVDHDVAGDGAYALVATDNFLAGQLAGQQLAERLGRGGRVGMLRLRPGLQSTEERERGFLLAAQATGLQVVFDTYLGDDRQRIAEALSQQLPKLDGLFSPNGTSSRATLAALRQLGKAGTLDFVGFDGGDLLFDAVRKGEIHALLLQQPQAMGDHAVRLVHRALSGERAISRLQLLLEPNVVTARDLAEMTAPQ